LIEPTIPTLLINKLKAYGFGNSQIFDISVVLFIHIGHTQIVKYANYLSYQIPQGYHILSAIIVLSINNNPNVHYNSLLLDEKIYKNIICITDDAIKLQRDLNNTYKRCRENDLHIHLNKCSTITFS